MVIKSGDQTCMHKLQGKCGSLTVQPDTLKELVSLERLELVQNPTFPCPACCFACLDTLLLEHTMARSSEPSFLSVILVPLVISMVCLCILVILIVAPQNTCVGFSQLLSPTSSGNVMTELIRYNEATPPGGV